MGKILFTTAEMIKIELQVTQLKEKLKSVSRASSANITTIANCIASDNMANPLKTFSQKIEEHRQALERNLNELNSYLNSKIKEYTKVDLEGQQGLEEVQRLVNNIIE
ncbi:MAG: hypothetical protein IJO33_03780 [Bacilli bacterium]|nr:hypothetical protein [Bacilli bacterium]